MDRVPIDPNGLPIPLLNLDIPLSDASLSADVKQELVFANCGINGVFTPNSGTPLSPGETRTILEILGKGRLSQVRFLSKSNMVPLIRIYLDGVNIAQYLHRPAYFRDVLGPTTGKVGFAELIRYDESELEFTVLYNTSELGSFGESAKVELHNDGSEDASAHVFCFYFIKSSEWLEVPEPDKWESLEEIKRAVMGVGLRERDVSVIKKAYMVEETELSFKVSIIIHPDIPDSLKGKIREVLGI